MNAATIIAFDDAWSAGGSYTDARDRAIAAIDAIIRADERERAAHRLHAFLNDEEGSGVYNDDDLIAVVRGQQ